MSDTTETPNSPNEAPLENPAPAVSPGPEATPVVEPANAPSPEPTPAAVPQGSEDDGDTLVTAAKAGTGKDGEGSQDPAPATDVAPEAYDLKLTTKGEDGKDVEVAIDTALLETATPVLKELGLTNDQANKLAPLVLDIQNRAATAQADAFEEMSKGWAASVKADPEIGGKNWEATNHSMGRALDRFGSDELKSILNDSRLGNHPTVVKFFKSVGDALGEDQNLPRDTSGAGTVKKDSAAVLYPNDQPKT